MAAHTAMTVISNQPELSQSEPALPEPTSSEPILPTPSQTTPLTLPFPLVLLALSRQLVAIVATLRVRI